MSGGDPEPPAGEGVPAKAVARKKRGRIVLFAVLGLVLVGGGGAAAAYLAGLPPFGGAHGTEEAAAPPPRPPVFVEIPDIVANLNGGGRRPVYVKMRARLEVSRQQDVAAVQAAMPRLLDMFGSFLRETRPEELRGSAGTHRLREELIARANIAVREGTVADVLFVELVVQ